MVRQLGCRDILLSILTRVVLVFLEAYPSISCVLSGISYPQSKDFRMRAVCAMLSMECVALSWHWEALSTVGNMQNTQILYLPAIMPEMLKKQHHLCSDFRISFAFSLEDRQSWIPRLLQRPLYVSGFSSTYEHEFWVQKFIINICTLYIRKRMGQSLTVSKDGCI